MNKIIKRNDPCPCGSGKKYKHCCGRENPPNSNNQLANEQLLTLHRNFISSAMDKYAVTLNHMIERHHASSIEDDEQTTEIFQTGLIPWILLNSEYSNGKTFFEHFAAKNTSNLSKQTKRIFSSWQNEQPGVYEVVSLNNDTHRVTLKNIVTDKTTEIPSGEDDNFMEGSLIIGILVPYADYYGFFYTMIKLYKRNIKDLSSLLNQHKDNLNKTFPTFLSKALLLGNEENTWTNTRDEAVAQRFANNIATKNVSDDIVFQGVTLWKKYCKESSPVYKNINPYAAALEYIVQKNILDHSEVTQAQLASEYSCSTASLSTNYRKMIRELED